MNFRTKIAASSLPLIFFIGLFIGLFVELEVKAAEEIKVKIDGQEISFSQAPLISEGRVLVPLRGIFEEMGAVVIWHKEQDAVEISKEEIKITLKIGNQAVLKNNEVIHADVPPQIIKGTTYVPLRLIIEAVDARVKWSNESRTVDIITLSIQTAQTLDQLFAVLEFEDYDLSVLQRYPGRLLIFLMKDELFSYSDSIDTGQYTVAVYKATKEQYVALARKLLELRGVPLGEDFEEMIKYALEHQEQLHTKQYDDYLLKFISTEGTHVVTIGIGVYFPDFE